MSTRSVSATVTQTRPTVLTFSFVFRFDIGASSLVGYTNSDCARAGNSSRGGGGAEVPIDPAERVRERLALLAQVRERAHEPPLPFGGESKEPDAPVLGRLLAPDQT